MNNQLTDPKAPVTERELDQLIWGLERYGLYPRQLAALKELREWRKAAGAVQKCRSNEKVQVLDGNSPATPDGWKEEAEKLAEAYGSGTEKSLYALTRRNSGSDSTRQRQRRLNSGPITRVRL